jgi:hypothetical protein
MERSQLSGRSWCAILWLGETIVDSQGSSIYPTMVPQPIKQCKLGLIGGPPARVTQSEKAKPTTRPLRSQTPWRNEQHRSNRYELPPLHSIPIAA